MCKVGTAEGLTYLVSPYTCRTLRPPGMQVCKSFRPGFSYCFHSYVKFIDNDCSVYKIGWEKLFHIPQAE